MNLSDSMHELAKVLTSMPSDLDVEVNVTTKVHDDVPPMFAEAFVDAADKSRYQRVIETQNGIVTKAIMLWIHD